jgi:hypothetical protein
MIINYPPHFCFFHLLGGKHNASWFFVSFVGIFLLLLSSLLVLEASLKGAVGLYLARYLWVALKLGCVA